MEELVKELLREMQSIARARVAAGGATIDIDEQTEFALRCAEQADAEISQTARRAPLIAAAAHALMAVGQIDENVALAGTLGEWAMFGPREEVAHVG